MRLLVLEVEIVCNTETVFDFRYKDSRPYPWPGGESTFILYPESANQTIYTQEVRTSDAGRYSCRARNDTTTLEGDITLEVLGELPPPFYYSRRRDLCDCLVTLAAYRLNLLFDLMRPRPPKSAHL